LGKEIETMKHDMTARNIILSALDCARLRDLLATARQFSSAQSRILDILEREMARAKIVPADEIPPYVVTMNTCVCIIDTATNTETKYTLVYPSEADLPQGKLSILSEMGVAIIGFSVGDTIEWEFPDGIRRLRIGTICFQPEATKRYDH